MVWKAKNKSAFDPGTIYSDDEVVCSSSSSDEEDRIMLARERISQSIKGKKRTTKKRKLGGNDKDDANNFFSDLVSQSEFAETEKPPKKDISVKSDKSKFGEIAKYMDDKRSRDINPAIERVLAESNRKKKTQKSKDIKDSCDVNSTIENVLTDWKKQIKSDGKEEQSKNIDKNANTVKGDCDDPSNKNKLDILKIRARDVAKKEKKKERKAKEADDQLERDKLTYHFEDAPMANPDATFSQMNLTAPLLKAVAVLGYQNPTPIQANTIPVALKGRDICGCAATGTGKTAAFMLPILQRLIFKPNTDALTRVLVLVPTRELGIQVFTVSKDLAQFTSISISLSVGGLKMTTQTDELLLSPDVIIATPGRLIDHIRNTPAFSLQNIEILVLDEADRMLDELFEDQLKEIIQQCCPTRQTMLFSATMTDEVKDLVSVSLQNPVRVFVDNNTDVAKNLCQEFIRIRNNDSSSRLAVLAYLLCEQFEDQTIVFTTTKQECHHLHIVIGLLGIKCGELHGDLKQNDRLSSLQKFKDKETDVLFATDVASRGLDIPGVKTVINYAVPQTYKTYVHRVGRTARAGFSGRSVTIAFKSGKDKTLLATIKRHSLTPLYERIIKSDIISKYCQKIDEIKPAIAKVFALQEEEKKKRIASEQNEIIKAKDKKKAKKVPKKIKNRKTRERQTNFETAEEIAQEKARLRSILAGNLGLILKKQQHRRKKPPMAIRKPKPEVIKQLKSKSIQQHQGDYEESRHKRKSLFDKEIIGSNSQLQKKLKKSASKENFEKQNPTNNFKAKEFNKK